VRDPSDDADVYVRIGAADLVLLGTGALNGVEAFMTGRIRVQGNTEFGMRLADILA
jgi:putative sterol carrier protein